jgi:hypothetical protein
MRLNLQKKIVLLKTTDGKLIFHPFGYHKFLLSIFGLFLDDTRGLIIGLLVGCFFDMRFIRKVAPPKHADLRLSFLMLAAFILQVTGLDAALSAKTITTRLNAQFGEVYIEKRMHFFRELLRQRIQVEAICEQLKSNATLDEKISLIKFLFEISSHPRLNFEKLNQTIHYLSNRIDLDSRYVKQLSAQYASAKTSAPPDSSEHKTTTGDIYSVFGLQADCTDRQLKKAYHQLAKKYHPDAHPGLSAAEKKILQEQFRIITEAYDKIKIMRGWK